MRLELGDRVPEFLSFVDHRVKVRQLIETLIVIEHLFIHNKPVLTLVLEEALLLDPLLLAEFEG
jgi:hypothetical protein